MKKMQTFFSTCCLLLAFASCSTVQEPARDQSGAETETLPDDSQALGRLKEFYENGLQKINQGVISEGITQLVSVLAEYDDLKNTGRTNPEIEKVVHNAETELAKIGAGLTMDSGTEWLDENKNQISASSLDIGSNTGLDPSIILTLNFGGGRALVAGAPILFEFTKGNGLLTIFVTTNDYGQANCSIARLENQNEENIVKASLIYRVKDFSYRFQGVEKEFVYVPPARRATILVMERAEDTVSSDPVILDAVYNRLKGVTFDFSQYNGVLLGKDFVRIFGGDPKTIKSLGLEKGVSYLVMVLSEGDYVSQVELGGKKYDIFKSNTSASTRIIRVVDGKIMYSGTVQGVPGQGGTRQKAIIDGFRNAAEAMAEKINQDLTQIISALSGESE